MKALVGSRKLVLVGTAHPTDYAYRVDVHIDCIVHFAEPSQQYEME